MKKSKVLTKGVPLALSFAMLPSLIVVPVMADTTQEINAPQTAETKVLCDIESTFSVNLPKEISLSGEAQSANYNVTADVDLTASEYLKVAPDETVTLSQLNKDDKIADITQETNYLSNALKSTTGSIQARDLTSGCWEGNFNFNVEITNDNGGIIYYESGLPGLYLDGKMTKSWDELISEGLITVYEDGSLTKANTNLEGDLIIADSVTKIRDAGSRDFAFAGCQELTSVVIPDSVTELGNGVFSACYSLTSVTIPNSITYIDHGAFKNCTSLTSITIPDSVTKVGNWLFYGSGLTSITIPDTLKIIGNGMLCKCENLTSVTYKGVEYTNKTALNNKLKADGITKYNIWTDKEQY